MIVSQIEEETNNACELPIFRCRDDFVMARFRTFPLRVLVQDDAAQIEVKRADRLPIRILGKEYPQILQ